MLSAIVEAAPAALRYKPDQLTEALGPAADAAQDAYRAKYRLWLASRRLLHALGDADECRFEDGQTVTREELEAVRRPRQSKLRRSAQDEDGDAIAVEFLLTVECINCGKHMADFALTPVIGLVMALPLRLRGRLVGNPSTGTYRMTCPCGNRPAIGAERLTGFMNLARQRLKRPNLRVSDHAITQAPL